MQDGKKNAPVVDPRLDRIATSWILDASGVDVGSSMRSRPPPAHHLFTTHLHTFPGFEHGYSDVRIGEITGEFKYECETNPNPRQSSRGRASVSPTIALSVIKR